MRKFTAKLKKKDLTLLFTPSSSTKKKKKSSITLNYNDDELLLMTPHHAHKKPSALMTLMTAIPCPALIYFTKKHKITPEEEVRSLMKKSKKLKKLMVTIDLRDEEERGSVSLFYKD